MIDLVLGIDTGGTYTDGVLMEYESRRVLATFKSLTTRRDFAIGIEKVIDGIQIDDLSAVKMVSISTTLATNAIAQGQENLRGRRVALLLIGYDPELVDKFKMAQHFGTPHFDFFKGGHNVYGREKEPLDLTAVAEYVEGLKDTVDAIAISSYFSPLNPDHENQVNRVISNICDLPVVLGHQLSTKLGSVERATTAALNASLLSVLQTLMVAVRRAMANRGIDAPLMVVRGDGTLMNHTFAARTPVETIHSGPAASAIGGRFLSAMDDALVIDVGGTTTDIALIENGLVAVSEDGARVNGYKTSVQAANILSIALGGDSHITVKPGNKLAVGPERVVPLAYLARQFPQILTHFENLSRRLRMHMTFDWLEFWFLTEGGEESGTAYTNHEKALLRLLGGGPLPVPLILKHLEVLHIGQIDAATLWRQELLGKAGLTPTDLMHVEGHYTPWDIAAPDLALNALYPFLFRNKEDLHRQVWQEMTEIVVREIVTFLSGKEIPSADHARIDDRAGQWFFRNSLYEMHPYLETRFRLRLPIIGIGAAAHVVLEEVSDFLHTKLVLPEHHEVANAIGTVAGSVMVTEEALVYPQLSSEGFEVLGYFVQVGNGRFHCQELHEALSYARKTCREKVMQAAYAAGADNAQIIVEDKPNGLDSFRIQARAVGKPRLGSAKEVITPPSY
jgi:N-methylhydantoinase A/oxoprolinase/acetone carboxylase beta subunit